MSNNSNTIMNSVKISTWNSRGLSASIPYVRELIKQNDFLLITEHWLHSNKLNELDDLSSDTQWHARSSLHSNSDNYGMRRGQGGIAILWNDNIRGVTPLKEIIHDRICCVKFQNSAGCTFNIFCVYLPAQGSCDDLQQVLDELAAIVECTEIGSINIIGGDFNGDIGREGGPRSLKPPTRPGQLVVSFIKKYRMIATNMLETTTGPVETYGNGSNMSCIDYILIPDDIRDRLLQSSVAPYCALNTSDHLPVMIHIDLGDVIRTTTKTRSKGRIRWDKLTSVDMYNRYTYQVTQRVNEILHEYENSNPTPSNLDNLVNQTVEVMRVAEKSVPFSKFRKHLRPYWCADLDILKKHKMKCYREWCDAGKPRDHENIFRINNIAAKKNFNKCLRHLKKQYEDENIKKASSAADIDKNTFWQILKRERSNGKSSINAIRDQNERVVSDPQQIMDVWKVHFSKLSTPKNDPNFDETHFNRVTEDVKNWYGRQDNDIYSEEYFSIDEIRKGIMELNSGKAPGCDGLTKEHLVHAGEGIIPVLHLIFRWIIDIEHIPSNFRRGTQVPLYKGKNAPTLDTNSYRGITLLNTLNKLFEVLFWRRMKDWWLNETPMTRLQGACRSGVSSLHTAMVLHETVSTLPERNRNVFVVFYDVSKAFNGVWIDGLFHQMRSIGIVGKTWRLFYKSYIDFQCRVRVGDELSEWYPMLCGIHQGGYLSLIKYAVFINSLLVELENSEMCSVIYGIRTSPLGYADDIASASISRGRIEAVMKIVFAHSARWRYSFNASKSAILIYGESPRERVVNAAYRQFALGKSKIPKKTLYDHLGVKCSSTGNNNERTKDKIAKGRKALGAASGIGLKRGGISMIACNLVFWSFIVPMVTYGTEVWVLDETDINLLEDFQKYAGRRLQRFSSRSPSQTSYTCLGWIRLEVFIYVKKLLFIKTIANMDDDFVYKKVFKARTLKFDRNIEIGMINQYNSPVFDILKVAIMFDLYEESVRMIFGLRNFSKREWKDLVWRRACVIIYQ